MNRYFDSTMILAIMSSWLYLIGSAHHIGFISFSNLSIEMMDKDATSLVFEGVLLLVPAGFKYIHFSLLIVGAVIIIGVTSLKLKRLKAENSSGNENEYNNQSEIEKNIELEKNRWVNIVRNIYFIYFVLTIILFSFALSFNAGKKNGEKVIYEFNKKDHDNTSLIEINEGKVFDGPLFFIGCGSRNCVAKDYKTSRIYYFDQSLGYSFVNIKSKSRRKN